MIDLFLLLGIALMILSLPLAVLSLVQTEPPRGAVTCFVLGLLIVFAVAWIDPDPFRVQDIAAAWARLSDAGSWMR